MDYRLKGETHINFVDTMTGRSDVFCFGNTSATSLRTLLLVTLISGELCVTMKVWAVANLYSMYF